jgi:hypothetical protein
MVVPTINSTRHGDKQMQKTKRLAALVAMVFAVVAFAAQGAHAQETVAVANAQAFLGTWDIEVEGTPLQIVVKDADGQVAADVSVMGTTSKVTTIARDGAALRLRYIADLQGQQAPIEIRLTPAGEQMATVIDVADGMFSVNGTATKR